MSGVPRGDARPPSAYTTRKRTKTLCSARRNDTTPRESATGAVSAAHLRHRARKQKHRRYVRFSLRPLRHRALTSLIDALDVHHVTRDEHRTPHTGREERKRLEQTRRGRRRPARPPQIRSPACDTVRFTKVRSIRSSLLRLAASHVLSEDRSSPHSLGMPYKRAARAHPAFNIALENSYTPTQQDPARSVSPQHGAARLQGH